MKNFFGNYILQFSENALELSLELRVLIIGCMQQTSCHRAATGTCCSCWCYTHDWASTCNHSTPHHITSHHITSHPLGGFGWCLSLSCSTALISKQSNEKRRKERERESQKERERGSKRSCLLNRATHLLMLQVFYTSWFPLLNPTVIWICIYI